MSKIRMNSPEEERRINEGIAADPDAYVPTDEEWAEMKPLTEEERARFHRVRGPGKAPRKRLVSIRLDPDVVEQLKAQGPGWQSRANALLRHALGL